MKTVRIDYFFELFEKNSIPKLFSKVYDPKNEKSIENPDFIEGTIDNAVNSVFFVPDYLQPVLGSESYTIKKIEQFFKGYAIVLDGHDSADAYVKYRFRSNAKGIRRRIKRLETCFQISYQTFYGNIEKEQYDFFMDSLEKMLIRRFKQRNDTSQSLLRWEYYKNLYFSLINEKKASMLVIFDRNQPILVSLNHHFHGRLFSAISSYDIDYGKYSLGSVEIYKKLDWCLANDHVSYEMGMGDLSYKREWSNHIYNFEHQIIYPKGSVLASIKGNIEFLKATIKEFIFKIAYVRYKNYKAKRKKNPVLSIKSEVSPIEAINNVLDGVQIDFNKEQYTFLRKTVYDFLYAAIENVSNVSVLKLNKQEHSFLIIGKSKMQHVVFENVPDKIDNLNSV